MELLQQQLSALIPAGELSHRQGNFLQHLVGVYEILLAWGCSEKICAAGLFHSIYGTEYFGTSLVNDEYRGDIQNLIGPESEALVYAFCRLGRNDIVSALNKQTDSDTFTLSEVISEAKQTITRQQIQQLLSIEMANLLEQLSEFDKSPAIMMWRLWQAAKVGAEISENHPIHLQDALSESQERDALLSYHQAIKQNASNPEQARALLNKCVSLNGVVGEVQLLLAAILLDEGEYAAAISYSCKGCLLLRQWACPWDKRLPLSDWLGIGERITKLASLGATNINLWPRMCQTLNNA